MTDQQKKEFIEALGKRDLPALEALIRAGCEADFRIGTKKRWWTPLMRAAADSFAREALPICELLVSAGAPSGNSEPRYSTDLRPA